MSAAEKLIAELRAKADAAKAEYERIKAEGGDSFDRRQRDALRAWCAATDTEYGARLMLRAVIAGEPS